MLNRKIDHRKRQVRQDLAAAVVTTTPAVTTEVATTTTTPAREALTTTTSVAVATTTTAAATTTTTTAAVVATTTTTTTVTTAKETTTTATTVAAVTTTTASTTTTTAARETTTAKTSTATSVVRSAITSTSVSAARGAVTTGAIVSSSASAALASSTSGSSSSGGGISGGAVAGIVIALLIVGGIAGTVWWKRRKVKAGEEELRKSYYRNTMNAGMAEEWKGAGGNGGYGSLSGGGGVGGNGNGFSEKFGESNGHLPMTGMSSPGPYNPSNPYNSPGPAMPMMASYPPSSNNVAPITLVDSPVLAPNNNSRQSLVNPFQNPPQIVYQQPPVQQNIPRSLTPSITPPHPLSPADTGFSHVTDNSNAPLIPPNVGSMYQQSQHQQSSSFGSSSVPKTVSMMSTSTINDKAIPSVLLAGTGGTPKVGETELNEFGGEEIADPFGGNQAGQGKIFTVVRTFEPTMGDELVIYPGDKVQILMSYDDGWVLGMNMSANPPQKGVFPRDCVEEGIVVPPSPSIVTDTETDSAPASKRNTLIPDAYHDHQITTTIPEGEEEEEGHAAVDHPLADPQRVSQIAPFLPPLSLEAPKSPTRTITGGESTFAAQQQSPSNSSPLQNPHSPVPTPRSPTTPTQPPQRESLVVTSESKDSVGSGVATPGKRTSSLIAGKDAELFMALGEALGDFGKVE